MIIIYANDDYHHRYKWWLSSYIQMMIIIYRNDDYHHIYKWLSFIEMVIIIIYTNDYHHIYKWWLSSYIQMMIVTWTHTILLQHTRVLARQGCPQRPEVWLHPIIRQIAWRYHFQSLIDSIDFPAVMLIAVFIHLGDPEYHTIIHNYLE